MPPQRVKGPPYLATLLIAVAVVAIIGFQSLRERRTSKALLEDKDTETNNLHKELEALRETSEEMRQTISKLSIEKDTLTLERNSLRKQLIDLEHAKSSTENEKNKLDLSLRGKTDEMDDLKLKVNELQQKEDELNLFKSQVKNLQKKIKLLETNHEGKISDHGKSASHLDAEQDKTEQGTENSQSSNMTTGIDSTTTNLLEKENKNKLHVRNSAEATKAGQAGDLSREKKSVDQNNMKNEEVEEGGQEKGDDLIDRIDPESLDKDTDDNDEEQVADKEEDENEEKEEDNAKSDEDEEEITDQQDDITEDIKQNIDHGDDNDHDEERADIE